MADVFEKTNKFASYSAKAEGNHNFLFLKKMSKSMTHFFNLCDGLPKKGQVKGEVQNHIWFWVLVKYFIIFGLATNFYFGVSLITITFNSKQRIVSSPLLSKFTTKKEAFQKHSLSCVFFI